MNRERQRKFGYAAKRKRGPRPLDQDPRRFEIAMWLLFTLSAEMANYEAAYLVMLLIGPVDISPLASIEDVLFVLSGERQQYGTNLEHYAERIRTRTVEVAQRAHEFERTTGRPSPDYGWLLHSMKNLAVVIANKSEPALTAQCFEELAALGWRECLLEARSRIVKVNQSNFPPHTEKLRRATAALLARMKSLKTPS